MKCQISGKVETLAGSFWIVRNTCTQIVLPIFTKKGLAGKLLIRSVRFFWASKRIVSVARFLNSILVLKLTFFQSFPKRKILNRTSPFFLKFSNLQAAFGNISSKGWYC